MKVKIIKSTSIKILEESINEFLATKISSHIIDIKYITVFDEEFYNEEKRGSISSYSALILYK